MTIWGPIPAIDGDDGRPVPEAFVGDATVTTNEPSQPECTWPPRRVVNVPSPAGADPVRAGRPPGRTGSHTS